MRSLCTLHALNNILKVISCSGEVCVFTLFLFHSAPEPITVVAHNGIPGDLVSRWFLPLFIQTSHTHTQTHDAEWVSGDSTQRNGVMLFGNTIPYSIFKTRLHLCLWWQPRTHLSIRRWCAGPTVACCDCPLSGCNEIWQKEKTKGRRGRSYLCHKSRCLSGRLQSPDWKCIRWSSTAEEKRKKERKERSFRININSYCVGKRQYSSSQETLQ